MEITRLAIGRFDNRCAVQHAISVEVCCHIPFDLTRNLSHANTGAERIGDDGDRDDEASWRSEHQESPGS
jgi:hypothetical protein